VKDEVLVVGAGIFGCTVAVRLAQNGYAVTLVEKDDGILKGTSARSVFRVHQGPHYPRSDATANQSRDSFELFCSIFEGSIDKNFLNFYAISKEASKVSSKEFREFVLRTQMKVSKTDLSVLEKFGVDISSIDTVWLCPEGVYDINRMRSYFLSIFFQLDIKLITEVEILGLERHDRGWHTLSSPKELGIFNFIVLATYATDKINFGESSSMPNKEFQKTLVLECAIPELNRLGLTVLDGDFLTLLPASFRETFHLYAPIPSVIARRTAGKIPKDFTSIPEGNLVENAKSKIIQRFSSYLPDHKNLEVVSELIATRVIPANSSASDRRTTEVSLLSKGLIEVFSGKVDHAVIASKRVLEIIEEHNY